MSNHNICMVSDFFYPNIGGIEEHIYLLSQCLLELGHKIIVMTHTYGDRKGVRWMTNGLKVYYVPAQVFYNGSILPTLVTLIPIIREILLREEITIVHGHGAFSSLAHDALFVAKLLHIKTVFTDHSLFGFADASAIITNRFLEISLADVNHCICVSHVGKANTVLRGNVHCDHVSVIPNAVDSSVFRPLDPNLEEIPSNERIIIIILSRLVYRKGVDLMAGVIPIICDKYNNVDFWIGGDGPKRLQLEEIREKYAERVQLFGRIEHSQVRDFMTRGHIFLNTSLTEAYCMAIVEAAACGLQVVSTRVGGIPEVLPPELIVLSDPNVSSLVSSIESAIQSRINGLFVNPIRANQIISKIYDWRDVAKRTQVVYNQVIQESNLKDIERISKYVKIDSLVGPLFVLVFVLGKLIMSICNYVIPEKLIDIAESFPNSSRTKQTGS